jgi:hypothetical protein
MANTKYTGLTEEQMISAMIEVATFNEYIPDEDDEEATFEDVFTTECTDWILEAYFTEPTESEKYIVQQVSERGSEGDGAEMFLTFKITDKETNTVGYLEYSGRYSSWDSSSYDDSYVVLPREVTIIKYTKVK